MRKSAKKQQSQVQTINTLTSVWFWQFFQK